MFAELDFGFEEDLVEAAATGAISLEMMGTVEVTKREGSLGPTGLPKPRVENY